MTRRDGEALGFDLMHFPPSFFPSLSFSVLSLADWWPGWFGWGAWFNQPLRSGLLFFLNFLLDWRAVLFFIFTIDEGGNWVKLYTNLIGKERGWEQLVDRWDCRAGSRKMGSMMR
jgi:hypothetical protein